MRKIVPGGLRACILLIVALAVVWPVDAARPRARRAAAATTRVAATRPASQPEAPVLRPTTAPASRPAMGEVKTPADLKALEARVRAVVERVRPAIIQVSGGSGVIVSPDGLVMSVAHVGGRANRPVTFTFPDGRRVRGVTLGNDREADAALMKITDKGPWPFVPLASPDDVTPGQWCIAMSYPVSFARRRAPVVRLGRVLRSTPVSVVTDCVIMGGDSGGALLDLDGRVIGISSRCNDSVRFNLHVPTSRFRLNWDRLARGEDFDPPGRFAFLGVAADQDDDQPRIGTIFPGSAADKAGLKVGDIVLSFAGRRIKQFEDLPPLVRRQKPGQKVSLEVRRDDKTLKFEVTLGSAGG